jgi:hypothetical protein
MTNQSLKSTLGWIIVGGQLALLSLVFILEILGRLDAEERKAVMSAVVPTIGVYFAAAVIHFLAGPPRKSRWAEERAPASRVLITILLPTLLLIALSIVIVLDAIGTSMKASVFSDYLGLLQGAQAFVSTSIYGYYFRKEAGMWKQRSDATEKTQPK